MKIEELDPTEGEEFETANDDDGPEYAADLWEAIDLLEKASVVFDALTEPSDSIEIPARLELKAFRLARKIKDFVSNWDYRNVEGEVEQ